MNSVLILTEHMDNGGAAVLNRAIRRSGFAQEQFTFHWGDGLGEVIRDCKPRAILALGNGPLWATTGLTGPYRGVGHFRGYPLLGNANVPVVASFDPGFLRKNNMALLSVLMDDIKLAVTIASTTPGQTGRFYGAVLSRDREWLHPTKWPDPVNPAIPPEYLTHPTPRDAENFLRYMEINKDAILSYDIETPRSGATSEDETDELAETKIISIQFSPRPRAGIFLPWREPFDGIARRVLALPHVKAGANTWRFDDPLLEAHGCTLGGVRHDVRWAWHHLQPDLKASLHFIASFYGMEMAWKHLHSSHPEYYGIADVDAVSRIMGKA